MVEVPLKDVGLMHVAEAAELLGVTSRAVQKWIEGGLLPVVVVSSKVFLLRVKDVGNFKRPPRGRPRSE